MKTRMAVACVAIISGGILLPTLAQEDKPPEWDQVLKMVETIAAKIPSQGGPEKPNKYDLKLMKIRNESFVLEQLLAIKKAEFTTIQAESNLYRMTHAESPR